MSVADNHQDPDAVERSRLRAGRFFDRAYYLGTYTDVAAAAIDPLQHFIEFGAREGRSPYPGCDVPYITSGGNGEMPPLLQHLLDAPDIAAVPRAPGPLRILLDTPRGTWLGENLGDVAMSAAAIMRFARCCPSCKITVVMDDPGVLAFSGVPFESVSSTAKDHWLENPTYAGCRRFASALNTADIVATAGHGALLDIAPGYWIGMMRVLDAARKNGARTALLGHGLGPFSDVRLRAVASEVLPRLDLLCVREHIDAPALLTNLGVPRSRIAITGDDALRICTPASGRPADAARVIGLSLRLHYGVSAEAASKVAAVARRIAAREHCEIVPLPIDGTDVQTLNRLGFPCEFHEDPREIIAAAGRCRAVIAGSYHAAVFSLAQGVPVVALSAEPFYRSKMSGLVASFPSGSTLAELNATPAPDIAGMLDWALSRNAEQRSELVASAIKQVELGDNAVAKLAQMAADSWTGGSG